MQEITVDATLDSIARITALADAELIAHGCSARARMQIDVAIDEIIGNIARYAYAPDTGRVTVQVNVADHTAEIVFIDEGIPFNPLSIGDPDVSLPAADRKIGGLGIFLVKKTMDNVYYAREGHRNILKLIKRI